MNTEETTSGSWRFKLTAHFISTKRPVVKGRRVFIKYASCLESAEDDVRRELAEAGFVATDVTCLSEEEV